MIDLINNKTGKNLLQKYSDILKKNTKNFKY